MRLVGESWPLPLSRSHYEYLALTHQAQLAPGLVPAVLHHDEALALIAMELLEPHIIMRKGLVAGTIYPRFVDHITTFLARTLFFSSDLAVPAAQKKEAIAAFCRQPRAVQDHRGPDLHRSLSRGRAEPLDLALARCDRRALSRGPRSACRDLPAQAQIHGHRPEALIHGDLHTGSIMVTENETRVIDPEFAFYGPMGFDLGAVIANLLMSYLASRRP